MVDRKKVAIALRLDEPYPHHQQVFEGIQRYAKEHQNWDCLIDEHPGAEPAKRGPNYPKYDGVIARADEAMQDRLKKMGVPLVNTHYQHMRPDVPGVYVDAVGVGRLAAMHLLERGYRRLYKIVDLSHRHSLASSEAFAKCAEEEGAECCIVVDVGEESYGKVGNWIDLERHNSEFLMRYEPPVGVFVEAAPHARILIQQSIAHGRKVPEDIAVICQHNLRAVVDISPQISRIEISQEVIGYKAAEMLDQLMAGKEIPQEHVFIPPVGVIACESTDYFAISDKVVYDAMQYISSRLDQKLRVDDIAYELAVSPSQLKKRFADSLGRSVGKEILRLRLEKAKRMLADRDRQVAQVAKASGFATADVMNQVFNRELGMTPTGYRKRILGWQT